ncbi:sensor histidine kinase [Aestuariibius insulae]|uniref:sensor histidine kinase n=1 Tax=Aestuariibius insulae TaxID=2058287 RepID=UPI00345E276C
MTSTMNDTTRLDPNRRALDLLDSQAAAFALSVLDSSADCIKLIELDGTLSFMNANGMAAMEIDDFDAIDGQLWTSLWPKEARQQLETAVEDARLGLTTRFEAFCPTARMTDRWWHVTVTPVSGPDGAMQRILAVSRDITPQIRYANSLSERDLQLQSYAERLTRELQEKDRLLAQQDLLAAEIDHRVKNSFALVSGVLRLQLRDLEDGAARAAVTDAANRIATIGRLHDQLHLSRGMREISLSEYLRVLCRDLTIAITEGTGEIRCEDIADRIVPADMAIALGLVTTELVGNAVKHGEADGSARIDVTLRDAGADLVLQVRDYGPGLTGGFDPTLSRGLGMKICQVYTQRLSGRLAARTHPEGGAEFTLTFKPVEPDAD